MVGLIKASVDCVTSDQQPCNKTRVTASNCTTLAATYYFTYCNLNSDPDTGKISLNNQTFGKINDRIINNTDFSILPTKTCRTFQETATINTCNNFFSASMKTEGTIADVARYQYCYDYNFIKFSPLIGSDPTYNYNRPWCDVTVSYGFHLLLSSFGETRNLCIYSHIHRIGQHSMYANVRREAM